MFPLLLPVVPTQVSVLPASPSTVPSLVFLFPFCSFNLSLSAFPFALMFYSMRVFPSAPPPNSQYVLVSLCHSLLAVFVACFFSCSLSLVCLIFFSCLHFPHQLVFCLPVLCSSFHMPVHSTFSLVNHVPSMLFSCFPPGFVFQCDFSFSSSHKLLPRLSCNFSSFPYLHCVIPAAFPSVHIALKSSVAFPFPTPPPSLSY